MWIVNDYKVGGFISMKQCVCVDVREGGTGDTPIYPIQYNWTNNLDYVGRELLGVEFVELQLVLDHWIFGPHHVWTFPDSGRIIRMYQPFNGLQIYPEGVGKRMFHLIGKYIRPDSNR